MTTTSPPVQTLKTPAIELGEEMVVTDEELDRVYGTDTPHSSPAPLMNAEDFLENAGDHIDEIPGWLQDACQRDINSDQPSSRRTVMGTLTIMSIIVLGALSFQYSDTFEAAWNSGKTEAAKYLGLAHAQ